jgi:prolyl-tRNA editing enzyme YbaK/EbsC (Cys-tRNA(Pro) deacylase)
MNVSLNPDNLATASPHTIALWPGFAFTQFFEHKKVVTCEEAADARNVPLENELKTIVMATPVGDIAVHLPANRRLHSGRVKSALGTRRIRFATGEELRAFGLQSGLVNPGNTGFCCRHLACHTLFDLEFVTTNAGHFTHGVAFDPTDLLTLPEITVGEFSHD